MEDEGRRAGRLRLRGEARCPGRGPACINSVGQRLIECEAPPAGAGRTLGLGRLSGQIGLKVGIPCQLAPRLGEKMDARGEAPCHQYRVAREDVPSAFSGYGDRADRKSVVSGKRVSVRVDPGGRRIIKQKKLQDNSKIKRD